MTKIKGEDHAAENAKLPTKSKVTHIVGAKLVSGEAVIGIKIKGGLQDVMAINAVPIAESNQVRILFNPFRPIMFIPKYSGIEVSDRFVISVYEVPAQVIDTYNEKLAALKEAAIGGK